MCLAKLSSVVKYQLSSNSSNKFAEGLQQKPNSNVHTYSWLIEFTPQFPADLVTFIEGCFLCNVTVCII